MTLAPEHYEAWLAPGHYNPGELQAMLHPFESDAMDCYAVATVVNKPQNDSPDCIHPLDETAEAGDS